MFILQTIAGSCILRKYTWVSQMLPVWNLHSCIPRYLVAPVELWKSGACERVEVKLIHFGRVRRNYRSSDGYPRQKLPKLLWCLWHPKDVCEFFGNRNCSLPELKWIHGSDDGWSSSVSKAYARHHRVYLPSLLTGNTNLSGKYLD